MTAPVEWLNLVRELVSTVMFDVTPVPVPITTTSGFPSESNVTRRTGAASAQLGAESAALG